MRKPSEILSYEQFVEEMKDPGFQARMHYGIDILLGYVEKDPSYLTGDDERIAKYWLQYYQHQGLETVDRDKIFPDWKKKFK